MSGVVAAVSDEELASQRPWTLALLTATLVSSYADRQVLSSLFEPIKRDLSLSDAQLGVLSGLAVAMFGALFGVHIARAADAAPLRRTVLAACLVAWSAATVSGGLASGFWSLLFSRVCVGVGEAGAIPISLAILADAYPQSARSVAMSVYYVGIPGGIILGLLVGGWLAKSPVGWRGAFVVSGMPGLPLACLVLTRLREPPRGYADRLSAAARGVGVGGEEREGEELLGGVPRRPEPGAAAGAGAGAGGGGDKAAPPAGPAGPAAAAAGPGLRVQLASLLGCRTFVCVLLGGALNLFTAIGTFAFMPSLATRRWGTDPGLAGTALAGVMVFGGASTVAGGAWADRAHARAARARGGAPSPGLYASFPALCCLAAFPFGALLCVAPSFGLCVALFLPQTAAANVPSGPLRCLVSTLVPGHSRAAANSVLEVGIGLAGGLGPVFVGAVSDALQARGWGDAAALARAMLAIQFASLPAALFLWMAAASAGADLALSARGEGWAAFKAAPPPDPDCYDSDSDT